jgi:hypothetical protein
VSGKPERSLGAKLGALTAALGTLASAGALLL